MNLSHSNAKALLLNLNQDIEEYAGWIVRTIIELKNFEAPFYPPNSGFTEPERAALAHMDDDEHLKSALRKMLAASAAGVVSDLLSVIDGVAEPKHFPESWTGIQLVDAEPAAHPEPFQELLHDSFWDTYWDWRKLRGQKDWKLDIYEA